MAEPQPRPVLITGAGRRIGLALAHHFLNQQPTGDRQLSHSIILRLTPCAKPARCVCRPISAATTVFLPSRKR